MTREECLHAISNVYNAKVTGTPEYWNFHVRTQPPKMIVLSSRFVETNINNNAMSQKAFEELLREIPTDRWSADKDGMLNLFLSE